MWRNLLIALGIVAGGIGWVIFWPSASKPVAEVSRPAMSLAQAADHFDDLWAQAGAPNTKDSTATLPFSISKPAYLKKDGTVCSSQEAMSAYQKTNIAAHCIQIPAAVPAVIVASAEELHKVRLIAPGLERDALDYWTSGQNLTNDPDQYVSEGLSIAAYSEIFARAKALFNAVSSQTAATNFVQATKKQ